MSHSNKVTSNIEFDITKTPTKTFEEIQVARRERLALVKNDIEAKKEQELKEMQAKLHRLSLEINSIQSNIVYEDRLYLNEKETLITILNNLKIEAKSRSAESRMKHLNEMETIQNQHENELKKLADSLKQLRNSSTQNTQEIPKELQRAQNDLRKSKHKIHELRSSKILEFRTDQVILQRIMNLESQKRELLQSIKEEESIVRNRMNEMESLLKDYELGYNEELQILQKEMEKQDNLYKEELSMLNAELARAQEKRNFFISQRKDKINEIQTKIDSVENDFKEKVLQANKIAEKLKTALVNANIRKNQQLDVERKRAEEQQALLKESFGLQQKISKLKSDIDKAKKESIQLRRDLTVKLGPRRAASLFV